MNKHTNNSSKGCVLEVSLEYPKDLHKLFDDHPLAPYEIDLFCIPIKKVKTLVANLLDKEKYVIHYENLRVYLRLGLKQKKYIED